MNKLVPIPKPCHLYRLRHPALRQVGCPVCNSFCTTIDLSKTVVANGPHKHPVLGPILGDVFSAIGKCDKGHTFIVRIANHRDIALTWTDIACNIEIPLGPDGKPLQVVGAYELVGDTMFEPAQFDSEIALELDKAEETGGADKLTIAQASQLKINEIEQQKKEEAKAGGIEGLIKDMQEELEKAKNSAPGDLAKDMQKYVPPPAEIGSLTKCHAGVVVAELFLDLTEGGHIHDVCLTCPNLDCPVNEVIQSILSERADNLVSCIDMHPHTTTSEELPEGPHKQFILHKSNSGNHKPKKAKKAKKAKAETTPMPKSKTGTKPNPKAEPLPYDSTAVVKGCPDKLTYGQALSPQCIKGYCAKCPVLSCHIHPKNKQENI